MCLHHPLFTVRRGHRPTKGAIVAFEIEVTSLEHVFKLSKDRDAESYKNIKKNLAKQGGDGREIAGEMEKRADEMFPEYIK